MKQELIDYINNNPNDKVIKPKQLQEYLDSIMPNVTDQNKNKERKLKATLLFLDLESPPTCTCGNPLKFTKPSDANPETRSPVGGWLEFCSKTCSLSSPLLVKRRQETNITRFGETSWAKSAEAQEFLQKGIPWSEERKEDFNKKCQQTNLRKRNVTHHSKTQEYLDKREQTNLERYNVTNTFFLPQAQQNKLDIHGYIGWFSTPEGKKFIKENNARNNPIIAEKIRLSFYNNRTHVNPELRTAIIEQNEELFHSLIHKTAELGSHRKDIAKNLGISYSNLNFYMRKFSMEDQYITIGKGTSYTEKEVYDFVKSLEPQTIWGDRTIIAPKELDVYVPNKNLAIEVNGEYFHSQHHGGKDPFYHQEKTFLCEERNIKLLHIFETEWKDPIKQEIWKSIIRNKLKMTPNKIFARKTIIKSLSNEEAKLYFEHNHLSGYRNGGEVRLGLFYGNELVSAIILGKSKTSLEYEIYRFASKLNTTVVGAFEKLIKATKITNLMTFADRRISSIHDSLYLKYFQTIEFTDPNWFGFDVKTMELKSRWNFTEERFKAIAKIYDPDKTIFDNMVDNGFDRIYDSGNLKFTNYLA